MAAVTQSPSQAHNRSVNSDSLKRLSLHSPLSSSDLQEQNALNFLATGNSDLGAFQPTFTMSNISATLEALNALRNGQFTNAAMAAAVMQKKLVVAAQQQQHQQQQTNTSSPPLKRARTSSTSGNSDVETPLSTVSEVESTAMQPEQQQKKPDEAVEEDQQSTAGATSTVPSAEAGDLQIQNESVASNNNLSVSAEILSTKKLAETLTASENEPRSVEIRALMDMQNKEHILRMKILEVQLQAAKHNRDLIEINKTFALQRLQEYASRRLTN